MSTLCDHQIDVNYTFGEMGTQMGAYSMINPFRHNKIGKRTQDSAANINTSKETPVNCSFFSNDNNKQHIRLKTEKT